MGPNCLSGVRYSTWSVMVQGCYWRAIRLMGGHMETSTGSHWSRAVDHRDIPLAAVTGFDFTDAVKDQ